MSAVRWVDVARSAGLRFRGERGEVVAYCPWHRDRHPSASLNLDKGVLFCHRCARGARVDRLDGALEVVRELPPVTTASPAPLRPAPSTDRAEAVYVYQDENRAPLFRVVRSRRRDGSKTFQQQPYIAGRGYCVGAGGMRGVRLVLYRLPEIIAGADPVVLVEGEKVADRLAREGLTVTTSPGGAGKWRDEYSETLRGRSVRILPDNDAPGMAHAAQALASIARAEGRPRVVALPGLRPKGDAYDWLTEHTVDELLEVLR